MSKGEIYLIHARYLNLYKIGVSKNSYKRKKSIQTGNPYIVSVVKKFDSENIFKLEKSLHNYYENFKEDSDHKELEGEWFSLGEEQVNEFLPLCEKIEYNIQTLKDLNNPFV